MEALLTTLLIIVLLAFFTLTKRGQSGRPRHREAKVVGGDPGSHGGAGGDGYGFDGGGCDGG